MTGKTIIHRKTKDRIFRTVLQILLILLSLIIVIPLLIMVLGAFKNSTEVTAFDLSLPEKWLVENFLIVFEEGNLLTAFKNNVLHSDYDFCEFSRIICDCKAKDKTVTVPVLFLFYGNDHSHADHADDQTVYRA